MKLMLMATAGFLFLAPVPAMASDPPADAGADETEGVDPNEIRCERRAHTGSRVARKRVCLTNAEWERLARDHRSQATDLQDRGTIDPGGDPPG